MKRIFIGIVLLLIANGSTGGILSCQDNFIMPGDPWSVIGLEGAYTGFYEASASFPGLTGEIIVDGLRNDGMTVEMQYTVTMSAAASRALAGVSIQAIAFLLHGQSNWINGSAQRIQAGTTMYTGMVTNNTGFNGLAIALANTGTDHYSGSIEAASDFFITASATFYRDSILYGATTHSITANGTMMVTDSLTFPDNINLGELEAGALTSAPIIIANESMNNLNPTFNLISTSGEASVKINDFTLIPGIPYIPFQESYRLGLWLPEHATPGMHSASVGVSWTCP